ncbi:hypothetical protein RAS_03140 [Rickettsia asiatica]|uniref:Uncharacterized protein n=1 Tax=Rickettsia asiatica TaxID=238800 RepID=A0A510G942_9RICK|nr:hypothetical protein RAS_03140 [Rickettsia asiatica]
MPDCFIGDLPLMNKISALTGHISLSISPVSAQTFTLVIFSSLIFERIKSSSLFGLAMDSIILKNKGAAEILPVNVP